MSELRRRNPPQGVQGMAVHGPEWQTDRTRQLWWVCVYSPLGSTSYVSNQHPGALLNDNAVVEVHHTFRLPADFVSLNSIKPVVGPEGNGNLVWNVAANLAANGELCNTHSAASGDQTTTIVLNSINEITDLVTLLGAAFWANLTALDYVDLEFERKGNAAGDTVNADVILLGYKISYEADM